MVEFIQYELFTEQTVKSADVYFLSGSWDYALMILRNLSPAFKAEAWIIIHERVLVDGPATRLTEKMSRQALLIVVSLNWESLDDSACQPC